ncbi:hypothetical protein BFJ72_g13816 [Fusarium proliferatum]|uniref:Heterokaryon incompatibility domain-containing protein n=1 Tax=Gibberella intermedia TaxID=948311 RepID=A0A420SA96_GIBIN|nr:hypothetical protein BFJ72_g13816 [Fusarium proliferatum]
MSNTRGKTCTRCYEMTGSREGFRALTSPSGYQHLSKIELEQSAEKGCPCCGMLWACALKMNKMWKRAEIWEPTVTAHCELESARLSFLRYTRRAEPGDGKAHFDIHLSAAPRKSPFFSLVLYGDVNTRSENPAASTVHHEPIVTTPGCELVMTTAKNMMDRCLAEHKKCGPNTLPDLPTRVLAIDKDSRYVRVHESTPGQQDRYIALSYVWGMKTQPVTTTADALKDYVRGIPVSSLPKTIKDAIMTATLLNIQYLWVDVLCIVQDKGHSDKKIELQKMGKYYQKATLVIAAAVSSDVTKGFLHPREPYPGCKLPLFLPKGSEGTIYLTPKVCGERAPEPLYSRAWALEEFLLPSRVLIFGTREAVWQCNSMEPQPVLPSNIDYDPSWPCRRLGTKDKRRDVWASVVANYTSRDMTYISDRLPAIDGFARVLEEKWKEKYVHGLWHDHLHKQLMWGSKSRTLLDPGQSRAPSWSWAATDGAVKIPPIFSCRKHAEINCHDSIEKGQGGQLCLFAIVRPFEQLRPLILEKKRALEIEPSFRTWSGVHDDHDMADDSGKLEFALLGFHAQGAFGLLLEPLLQDRKLFRRVGTIRRFLPGQPEWWGDIKEKIFII